MDFHGEEAPLNTNSTEEERAENRRVNFEIKYHLVDQLSAKLQRHIEFIDRTYDGLKNPIEAARKWLRK